MAKTVHDDVLDGALNIIKNNCTRQVACSAQPTTYAEGNATSEGSKVALVFGQMNEPPGARARRPCATSRTPSGWAR